MTSATDAYGPYAAEYSESVARRELGGADGDPYGILPSLLELVGDIDGQRVLDAGCGDGYLARVLARRGARVTGIDLAPNLIDIARSKDAAGDIEYLTGDLSLPQPAFAGRFDAVASYLVLNDLPGYRGFAATLAASLKPGGRMVIALNNPYCAVIHQHVADYFDSGAVSRYRGLWEQGINVYYHHRTLEDYLDAFLNAGLRLVKLADLSGRAAEARPHRLLPEGITFPRFMILVFTLPGP